MRKLLLETIRCENGRLLALDWHQERMARSRRALFGLEDSLDLQSLAPPPEAAQGIFRCRLLYDTEIRKVEFAPYHIRPVRKLKLIRGDGLDYSHKYANRSALQALFGQRGAADDVLIVINGLITDTTYANLALFDGAAWYTPASPLLPGTRRAALLSAGVLRPADITPGSLTNFRELRLINAMMNLEEGPGIRPEDILSA